MKFSFWSKFSSMKESNQVFSSFSGDIICFQSLYVMLRSFVMINDFGLFSSPRISVWIVFFNREQIPTKAFPLR